LLPDRQNLEIFAASKKEKKTTKVKTNEEQEIKKKSTSRRMSQNPNAPAATTASAANVPMLMGDVLSFKTRMCKNYAEAGSCRYGARCRFAHGDSDMRTQENNFDDGLTSEQALNAFQAGAKLRSPPCMQQHQPQVLQMPMPMQMQMPQMFMPPPLPMVMPMPMVLPTTAFGAPLPKATGDQGEESFGSMSLSGGFPAMGASASLPDQQQGSVTSLHSNSQTQAFHVPPAMLFQPQPQAPFMVAPQPGMVPMYYQQPSPAGYAVAGGGMYFPPPPPQPMFVPYQQQQQQQQGQQMVMMMPGQAQPMMMMMPLAP
jgi:hypothetical protein